MNDSSMGCEQMHMERIGSWVLAADSLAQPEVMEPRGRQRSTGLRNAPGW